MLPQEKNGGTTDQIVNEARSGGRSGRAFPASLNFVVFPSQSTLDTFERTP